MSPKTRTVILLSAGVASFVAFFLPFLDLGGLVTASGWEILLAEHAPWSTRLALMALPLGGVALVAAALTQSRKARLVGFLFGAGVYGYLGYTIVRLFLATTGAGLWLTLAAAAAAIAAALWSPRRR